MRLILTLTICLASFISFSQSTTNPVLSTHDDISYYSITNQAHKKLIIFLHGGVKNPVFSKPAEQIKLDFLLEENQVFVPQAIANGFDLIVPIVNDNLNWLMDEPQKTFDRLKKLIDQLPTTYNEIYLSGFSDGGTGSYKIFYSSQHNFDGVLIFNGYPQHKNHYRKVDYTTVKDKKVLFFGTTKDEVIPYEFLLTEYCKQKETNANTFIYLSEGNHSFSNYTEQDLTEVFDILTNKNQSNKTEPIQGFIKNDEVITLYPFRKKIVRKYNFGKETYEANKAQFK